MSTEPDAGHGRIGDEALEIGHLLLEILNRGYRPQRDPGAAHGAGLSPHAVRAAIHLYQHPGSSVGELARGLGMSTAWASRAADELVGAGYVERLRSEDRRVVRLRLVDAAVADLEPAYRPYAAAVDRALDALDPEAGLLVRRFLRRLVAELRDDR